MQEVSDCLMERACPRSGAPQRTRLEPDLDLTITRIPEISFLQFLSSARDENKAWVAALLLLSVGGILALSS